MRERIRERQVRRVGVRMGEGVDRRWMRGRVRMEMLWWRDFGVKGWFGGIVLNP